MCQPGIACSTPDCGLKAVPALWGYILPVVSASQPSAGSISELVLSPSDGFVGSLVLGLLPLWWLLLTFLVLVCKASCEYEMSKSHPSL